MPYRRIEVRFMFFYQIYKQWLNNSKEKSKGSLASRDGALQQLEAGAARFTEYMVSIGLEYQYEGPSGHPVTYKPFDYIQVWTLMD
jgi:hypothetical protein